MGIEALQEMPAVCSVYGGEMTALPPPLTFLLLTSTRAPHIGPVTLHAGWKFLDSADYLVKGSKVDRSAAGVQGEKNIALR